MKKGFSITYKKVYLILVILFFLNLISASTEVNDGMNINFKVSSYGLISLDELVVGDYFVYNISLEANQNLEDDLIINVISPNGEILDSRTKYINMKKGESFSYIPASSRGDGNLALPLDQQGVYKLEVCSSKLNTFYRWFEYPISSNYGLNTYIWYSECINFSFDAISHLDYSKNEESNKEYEQNQIQTRNMLNLTQWILGLTIVLVILQILTIWSTHEGKKTMASFLLFLPSIFVFWLAYNFFSLYQWTNPPDHFLLTICLILFVLGMILAGTAYRMIKKNSNSKRTKDERK